VALECKRSETLSDLTEGSKDSKVPKQRWEQRPFLFRFDGLPAPPSHRPTVLPSHRPTVPPSTDIPLSCSWFLASVFLQVILAPLDHFVSKGLEIYAASFLLV
jgi:hypothetical protein